MPEQGDILLVPIPFTDLSSQKRRPVIVVSNNDYNQKTADLVVVAMTSNPVEADYSFTITSDDLEKGRSTIQVKSAWIKFIRSPNPLWSKRLGG